LSEDKIYTVEQVAEQLHVHPKTVYRMLEADELQGVRVGRMWRITSDALNSFLKLPADQAKQSQDA
jgi:excisionase family DNA binding protein